MTCPSCGYPMPDRIGDWCAYCVADPEVRDDGSRPWAQVSDPLPFERDEIARYEERQRERDAIAAHAARARFRDLLDALSGQDADTHGA